MLTHRSALTAALFVGLAACQPAAPAGLSDADRAAMTKMDEDFAKMAMAADYAGLVKMYYADDAVLLAPNVAAATGHAAIEAVLRTLPPVSNFALEPTEMVGAGDMAYVRGRYVMTMTIPGAGAVPDSGKYLEIYRKQADGSWKVTRDMFNSDVPMPAPAAPATAKPGN